MCGLRPTAPLGYSLFFLCQTRNLTDPGRGLVVGRGQVPRGLCCLEQDSPLGVSLCRDSSLEGLAGPLCRSTSRGTERRQGHALCPLGQHPHLSSFDETARLVL